MLEKYRINLNNFIFKLSRKNNTNENKYEIIGMKNEAVSSVDNNMYEEDIDYAIEQILNYQEDELSEYRDGDYVDIKNSPAVKIVDYIIYNAVIKMASDIHIEPFKEYVSIRYRIDGELQEIHKFPYKILNSIVTRIKVISNIDISEKRKPQDGRIYKTFRDIHADLRVSTISTIFGEKVVIRILNKNNSLIKRSELGFTDYGDSIVKKLLNRPNGIILVTGPTGSGKSTTVYSLLREMDYARKNITTIEDPVEYVVEGINQINVNNKAGVTFTAGLRSILRQDPDIIMIGEIRDRETAEIAIRAAITGHIVLSTIHTNNSSSTIVRLMDMGIEPYLLSAALSGIMSQRLVKKICPCCKTKYIASQYEKKILNEDTNRNLILYKGSGCSNCDFKGYFGRTGIFEVMEVSPKHREIIAKKKGVEEILNESIHSGMKTLTEGCKEMVLNGTTTIEEFIKIFSDKI